MIWRLFWSKKKIATVPKADGASTRRPIESMSRLSGVPLQETSSAPQQTSPTPQQPNVAPQRPTAAPTLTSAASHQAKAAPQQVTTTTEYVKATPKKEEVTVSISEAIAQRAIAAGLAKAKELNSPSSIAILDSSRNLVAFQRMEGPCSPASKSRKARPIRPPRCK